MRDYELAVLLPTDEKGYKKTLELVKGAVATEKGKVVKIDDWGVKPLAYLIKKQTEAIYSILHISLEPPSVTKLDRALRMNEEVLRHLILIREGEVASLDKAQGKPIRQAQGKKAKKAERTEKTKKSNKKLGKKEIKKKVGGEK